MISGRALARARDDSIQAGSDEVIGERFGREACRERQEVCTPGSLVSTKGSARDASLTTF